MSIHEYTKDAVRKYLRTVLLVDDQLFDMESEQATGQEDGGRLFPSGIPDTLGSGISSSDHEMERPRHLEDNSCNPLDEEQSHNPLDDAPSRNPLDEEQSHNPLDDASPRNPLDDDTYPSQDSFSAPKVVDGFYQLSIVCGLYQPKTSEFLNGTVPQSLVDLCDHSDVFILDWKLKDNQPDSPVPVLIEQLLRRDESCGEPRAVRFCAIYTQEALGAVFSALHSEIKARFPQKTAEKDLPNYRIHLDGLTIRLYRKTDAPEAEGNPMRFVPSSDLAKTIIQDFVDEYEGIMSATALRGIAQVRDNTKRILDKFPKEMDPALVLHAGLTMHDADISKDITSLLSDETAAVLADTQIPSDDIYALCKEYVERECPDDFLSSIKDTPGLVPLDVSSGDIRSFFIQVFNDKKFPKKTTVFEPCKKNLHLHKIDINLLEALANLVRKKIIPNATYRFGALSALFCQKTNYGKTKLLRFGTVVGTVSEGDVPAEYYLCLMPTCDCLRLKDIDKRTDTKVKHRFPFWRLEKVSSDHQGRNYGVMILDGEEYSPYCVKGKIRQNFALYEFYSEGGIVKFDESLCVKNWDGSIHFKWAAELKSAHSQRMAEYVSREFSRVGLIESEWLRLQVDR